LRQPTELQTCPRIELTRRDRGHAFQRSYHRLPVTGERGVRETLEGRSDLRRQGRGSQPVSNPLDADGLLFVTQPIGAQRVSDDPKHDETREDELSLTTEWRAPGHRRERREGK